MKAIRTHDYRIRGYGNVNYIKQEDRQTVMYACFKENKPIAEK
jgi:hypothetical protein